MSDPTARRLEISNAVALRLARIPIDRTIRVSVESWEHIQGASFAHTVETVAVGQLDSETPILGLERSILTNNSPDPIRLAISTALRTAAEILSDDAVLDYATHHHLTSTTAVRSMLLDRVVRIERGEL